jgi:hypothetical protein
MQRIAAKESDVDDLKEPKVFADLLLDNGQLVRVEARQKDEDELYESIDMARRRGDWWSPDQFEDCSAAYLGHLISRVDMQRVVAML